MVIATCGVIPATRLAALPTISKRAAGELANRWPSRLRVSGSRYLDLVSRQLSQPKDRVADLQAQGVTPEPGRVSGSQLAMLLEYVGRTGPEYWLGFDTSHVITRYNRSQLYALAVSAQSGYPQQRESNSAESILKDCKKPHQSSTGCVGRVQGDDCYGEFLEPRLIEGVIGGRVGELQQRA